MALNQGAALAAMTCAGQRNGGEFGFDSPVGQQHVGVMALNHSAALTAMTCAVQRNEGEFGLDSIVDKQHVGI